VDEAVGTIAKVMDAARDMVANTTAFRTWDGASWTVEQAKVRIYLQTLPLVESVQDLAALRPFLCIWQPLHAVTWRQQAAPNSFRPRGTMVLEFHRSPPTLTASDPGASERSFANFLGKLVRSGDAAAPGLCELSGLAGYLSLESIRTDGIFRAEAEDVATVGDADLAYIELEWY
jgi:hypothetical protein